MCYNYGRIFGLWVKEGESIAVKTRKKLARQVPAAREESPRRYEMVLIVRPEASDEEVGAVLDGIKSIVSARDGEVEEVVMWGKRKLAYPISHAREGIYALLHFKTKPSANKELADSLRISEKVLRHLLVCMDEG